MQPNSLMVTLFQRIVLKSLNEFNKEFKVNTSIDWWKNEMIESHSLNVYWESPR